MKKRQLWKLYIIIFDSLVQTSCATLPSSLCSRVDCTSFRHMHTIYKACRVLHFVSHLSCGVCEHEVRRPHHREVAEDYQHQEPAPGHKSTGQPTRTNSVQSWCEARFSEQYIDWLHECEFLECNMSPNKRNKGSLASAMLYCKTIVVVFHYWSKLQMYVTRQSSN